MDDDLKKEVEELKEKLEAEERRRHDEATTDFLSTIIWLAMFGGLIYWLVNGGFGQVGRFLFWQGIFQH